MLSLFFFLVFISALFFINSYKFKIFSIFLVFLFLLITIFNYTVYFYYGNFLNLSLINILAISLKDAPLLSFWKEILLILFAIFGAILFCILLWQSVKISKIEIKFASFFSLAVFALAIFFNPLTNSCIGIFQILNPKYHKVFRSQLQAHIVEPNPNSNFKKKNIVYIYLESFSRDFTTKFDNLTPNLNAISNRLDFTNINQIPQGATVTMEGIFASQCGLPFGFFARPSKRGEQVITKGSGMKFPKNILCATQILQNKGYYTYFIKSDHLKYQRTKEFLQSRNYDEIKGALELKKMGAKSENEWGIDDDEMFDFAWQDFQKLSQSKEKFIQVVLNIGMHSPSGFVSKKCENLNRNFSGMLRAVHCTDFLVSDFISKIRSSKYSNDTIIAIQSDHLMPYLLVSDLRQSDLENSKLFFTILDDDLQGVSEISNHGSSLDTFTTLLGYLGLVDEMNLGRNILKKESLNLIPNIGNVYNTAILSLDDLDYESLF